MICFHTFKFYSKNIIYKKSFKYILFFIDLIYKVLEEKNYTYLIEHKFRIIISEHKIKDRQKFSDFRLKNVV